MIPSCAKELLLLDEFTYELFAQLGLSDKIEFRGKRKTGGKKFKVSFFKLMFPFQQQQQPFQGQQQPPLQQQQQQPFYNPSNGIPMAGQPAFPAASNVLNGPYVVQPTNSIQTMNPQQASSIGYGQAQQHPMAPMTGVLGGQAVASQQPILSPASSMIFPQQQMQPQMQQQMGLYHQPQLSQSSSQQAIYSSSASLSFRGSHTSLYGQQQEAQCKLSINWVSNSL